MPSEDYEERRSWTTLRKQVFHGCEKALENAPAEISQERCYQERQRERRNAAAANCKPQVTKVEGYWESFGSGFAWTDFERGTVAKLVHFSPATGYPPLKHVRGMGGDESEIVGNSPTQRIVLK
eukprot:CAMPEP_0184330264 /NCGR_PEP_ID=MMETSP1049-20130417/144552_1 /TAXON_ID=77928 /ORGANISM="Proteomonas sulcata, Strain CCMP704" /LENGTH=123 /DNA_ID=CAMNT_0026652689 /DNA_START=787 /DNA_END=1159 /DNA_ORIENTATION=-